MKIAGSGFADDVRTAEPDAAEFGAKWIVVDSDFLDLVFRRNTAAGESIDDERHLGAGFSA